MIRRFLFVCTGNLCRSPMASSLFAARARVRGRKVEVASAGVAACVGKPPPEPVISLMDTRGLDVSGHRARQLSIELASPCDLILVMEVAQQRFIENYWHDLKGRVRRLGEWRDEDVLDPFGQSDEAYATCLSRIEACLDDWQARLLT